MREPRPFDITGVREAIWELADPLSILDRIVTQALVLVPAADGAVVELAEGDGCLRYVCAKGTIEPYVGLRLSLADSLSGRVMRWGETVRCDDTERDTRVDRVACRRLNILSMICVPLVRGRQSVGVLKVSSSRRGAFSDADVAALAPLAEFVTAAVRAAAELHEVTERVLGDPRGSRESSAAFVANVLQPGIVDEVDSRRRVMRVIQDRALSIVLQPIVDLDSGAVVGAEALSRFAAVPVRPPNEWFEEARACGLGNELELTAVEAALTCLERLPRGTYLAVNAGPETIADPRFAELVRPHAARVVVELTEHERIDDYGALRTAVEAVRKMGARLAIDDTGAGVSSMSHILKLRPDVIKLDREIITDIHLDPARRALAIALLALARELDAHVVAEGIEQGDELLALHALGIRYGQGFAIGRPGPVEDLRPSIGYAALASRPTG